MTTAIVWFRRDLRVHDHPSLTTAAREYDRIVPVFVLDPALLVGRYRSSPRTDFMLGCLRALDQELRGRGSGLVIRRGEPEEVLRGLAEDVGASAVLWTSDVSPYARRRDRRVSEALRGAGVAPRPQGGNYIVDVSKLRTAGADPYRVFSPFHRAWAKVERRPVHPAPAALAPLPSGLALRSLPGSADALGLDAMPELRDPVVDPGERPARQAADRWFANKLQDYADRQDGVSRLATSQLSPYLRWGCLSPLELEQRARKHPGPGAAAWIRQLCWRDFYAHVLFHWPANVAREFQPAMRELEWDDDAEQLTAWQRGETGYPIVDAGMRQLAQTGWMHNRARLIVGSFLTKDLHLDWRSGEEWFARLLLDGEPAQNNGNWQWIASVGTDPAPIYRRLYNPTLQAKRFDPAGTYVRRWVPELEDVPLDCLHEPWTMNQAQQREAGCRIGRDYAAPVVEHAEERKRALERYAAARAGD
jgi:deoxyribodipyrimidine photo-lyase